jgi:hypothetical protein
MFLQPQASLPSFDTTTRLIHKSAVKMTAAVESVLVVAHLA